MQGLTMFDIYFDLITKLKDKLEAGSNPERRNIQQDIKRIADKLQKQSEIGDAIFDAAFAIILLAIMFMLRH
jgi:hypothetical protein